MESCTLVDYLLMEEMIPMAALQQSLHVLHIHFFKVVGLSSPELVLLRMLVDPLVEIQQLSMVVPLHNPSWL